MVIDTTRASGDQGLEIEMSYRAAYWISADRQSSVVLTTADQAHLNDAELLAAGHAEAEIVGLDISDGEITINDWLCGLAEPAETYSVALFSTGPAAATPNHDATPARVAPRRDIVAWVTRVTISAANLSPLAAWLVKNVRSTLHSGTTLRVTSSQLASEHMRAAGRSEDYIRRVVAVYGDTHDTIDWRFSQYRPDRETAEEWFEREAARILAMKPSHVRAGGVADDVVEFIVQ